ncbi:hypothetical protein Peur_033461 [Populus x canadensis]
MGSMFLNSPLPASNKLIRVSSKCDWCFLRWRKRNVVVYCQGGGGKAIRSSGFPSVLTERSAVVSDQEHIASVRDAGSLVLSPNEKGQPEIAVEDFVPYGGPTSSSLLEMQDGIGIVKFLRGKGLFISGATGFLAKVLIEKILRTMPDVGKIYVLIKAESKEAAITRLKNEIINAELFKCLRQTHGKSYQSFMLNKLVPVVGNVCESNLGLEEDLADKIANEVDIIVNSAANTTFDERYDVAIDVNTRGTCHLMSFAKKCPKLKLFLQVSTAYVNGQRQGRIMEKPFLFGDCIARENLIISDSTPRFAPALDIEHEMNLALDSKEAFQENEVAQKMKELGLERMMDPIVLYYGKGQLTGFLVDPNGVLDVVPADMVVNATLAAMAWHGMEQKPDINVYQIASSVVNPLVFQDLATLLHEHYNSSPYMDSNGRPIQVPSMKLFSSMEEFSAHLWRYVTQRSRLAGMATSDRKLSQKHENICRKSVEQAKYLASIYEPYTFYGGRFDNSNTQKLMERMSENEKGIFGFDVGSIDWRDYITNVHIPGLRRHVMKGRGMCG